ncbi:MAG: hypothetical protein K6G10_11500 [Butyrivibrio sp.]|nr:hypothetical protein [Butyrivibrio sp.]
MTDVLRYEDERIKRNRIKRMKIVKRQRFMLAAMLVVVVFSAVFMFFVLSADAESDTFEPSYKYYRQITIGAGQCLEEIAAANISFDHYKNIEEYEHEVAAINHLDEEGTIYAGESLIIPYYSHEYR